VLATVGAMPIKKSDTCAAHFAKIALSIGNIRRVMKNIETTQETKDNFSSLHAALHNCRLSTIRDLKTYEANWLEEEERLFGADVAMDEPDAEKEGEEEEEEEDGSDNESSNSDKQDNSTILPFVTRNAFFSSASSSSAAPGGGGGGGAPVPNVVVDSDPRLIRHYFKKKQRAQRPRSLRRSREFGRRIHRS